MTFQDDDQNDETLTSAAFPSAATIRPADRTEPMLQTRMVNLAALQLTYDEALDETSTPAASAFDVMVASVTRALAANDPVAVSGRTVTLTLAAAVSQGETVTVSYAIPATNPIRDESENNAAARTNLSVTNNTSGLTVNDANATEGSAVSFSVILGPASATAVTVDWTASVATGNTAEASDLGTPLTGSLTFTAGQTLKSFTVNTAQDTIDEDNETFTVTLSNPVGASITDGTAVGTVNDNDNAPVVSVAAASGEEGEDIEFTVTLSSASEKSAEVHWSTSIASNDTAVQGDFTADSGTSTFSPGDTSKTFSVSTEEDTTDEVDETFTVTLSGHSNAGLSRTGTTAKGTIEDDDDAPTLSIAHTSATEGTAASFTVTLSEASGLQVTATWTASIESGDTAILSDLGTPRSGTVTIAAGRRTATLTVNTRHDTTDEPDETFMVTLSNASNAVLSDTAATATGTIQDDDPEPTLSVNDRSAAEGEAAQFTATLSAASAKQVMVSWTASAESDDTAVASDLGGTLSGTATIAAGGRTATFNVRSSEDTTDEPDETYTVTLSDPVNATLSDATGQGTITDDDNPPTVSIRKRDDVEEGDDEVAVIELSAASGKTVTVVWKTSIESGDTAEPGDFTAVPDTTITFVPGETSKDTGFVQTTQDTTDEEHETFTVKIVSATNATVEGRTSQMTIVDDDDPPSVSIADASANEGDTASFAVTLSEPSEKTVTVDWAAVHDGTVADDFTGTTSGQLVYTPGQDSKTVAIRTKEDNIDEIDERFSVELTLPANANATPEDVRADGRIRDDDETEVSVSGAGDVTEGEDAVFTLTLSNPNSRNITVYFVTEALTTGTTATPDVDFVALGAVGDFALMVIPAGETTDTIAVSTIDDDLDEPREPFRLSLAPPDADGVDLTLNRLQVRARINDNDDAPAVELVLTPATIGEDGGSTRITARLPATSSRSSRQTTVTVLASHAAPTEATDYDLSVDRVLTIPAEQRESTGTVTISANDNVVDAPDKTLTVSATVQNSLGATAPAARTLPIVNDEDEPRVTLALSDATIDETGGTTVLTATLSHPSSEDTTVTVTAQASSFTMSPATGRVTIAAGQTSGTGSVTLTAVDNATDAPDNAVTVTASANNGFRVAQPAGIALTIADDDLPPTVTLHLSGASTGEAGGSATVQARLSHPSSEDTTVTVSREGTVPRAAESVLTGARLAITAGSTASLGMATITPTDNETDAPDQVVQIGAAVLNSQGHAGAPAPIELTITDDEAPPTVTLHLSEVSISEEEGVTSVTATLSHPSSEATTVTVLTAPVPPAVSGDVTQSGDALSIAALATDSTGAVTVTAVPNFVDTLDKRVTVGGTAENGQGVEENAVAATLTLLDDDERGILASPEDSLFQEGNIDQPVTLRLTSQPTETVTVTMTSPDAAKLVLNHDNTFTATAVTLTFTTANWNEPQLITMDAYVDPDAANERHEVRLAAQGGDYGGLRDTYVVTVTDRDYKAKKVLLRARVNEGGRLFEDRGARSVTVTASLDGTLRLAPTAVLVTVAGGSAASTDFAASPSSFTLTVPAHSTDADAPLTASLTLTLTPVADDIDEDDETVIVSGTTAATVEDSTVLLQVESDTVEILDDDTRGVAVSAPSVSVEEGGTGSYTVVLESAPTETVTVTLTTSGDVDDLEIGPATLEFNADNWSIAKTVEIQSIADFDAVDEVVTVTHAVTGGDYGSNRVTADPVTVTVTDNDERGLELAPPESIAFDEGQSATYTVVLKTLPTGTVTVRPAVDDNPDVTVEPSSLTFTTSNYDEPQTVTVAARVDANDLDDRATVTHAVSGADYGSNNVVGPDLAVNVTDVSSTELISLSVSPVSVPEDGRRRTVRVTATLEGAARAVPTDVSVAVRGGTASSTDFSADPATLVVTIPADRAEGSGTFSLTATADALDEGTSETVTVSGTHAELEVDSANIEILDDDGRGFEVSRDSLVVTEGRTVTYTVALSAQPTGTVTVTLEASGSEHVKVVTQSLEFTVTNWGRGQTVTVEALHDPDGDDDDNATITHTATGGDYNGIAGNPVSVEVRDDDEASRFVQLSLNRVQVTIPAAHAGA